MIRKIVTTGIIFLMAFSCAACSSVNYTATKPDKKQPETYVVSNEEIKNSDGNPLYVDFSDNMKITKQDNEIKVNIAKRDDKSKYSLVTYSLIGMSFNESNNVVITDDDVNQIVYTYDEKDINEKIITIRFTITDYDNSDNQLGEDYSLEATYERAGGGKWKKIEKTW